MKRPGVALIVNPAAGRGHDDLAELLAHFGDERPEHVLETSASRDADVCAREALAQGAHTLLVAGGDGTVSLVAAEAVRAGATLGVIPLGTSNSIADALGLGRTPDEALAWLRAGHVRRIDTMSVNGRCAVLTASIGVYADTIGTTTREEKNRWGLLAYAATALAQLKALTPVRVSLSLDGRTFECDATAVTVANLAPPRCLFAQGAAEIIPDDGLLDVTLVTACDVGELVSAGIHLLRTAGEREADHDCIAVARVRHARVLASPTCRAIADGEDLGEVDLDVRCVPASLAVLAPP